LGKKVKDRGVQSSQDREEPEASGNEAKEACPLNGTRLFRGSGPSRKGIGKLSESSEREMETR